MENQKKLISRLIAYRKENGLSQLEMAEKLGISRRAYIYYEKCERSINYDLGKKIEKILIST